MLQTPQRKYSGKMVDFIETPTETIEVQHRSDMSSEAVSNTWYSQDEISATIAANSRACFLLQRSKYLGETEDFCYRGLEHIFLPDHSVRRQKVMSDSKDAVLHEQDRQLTNNSFNEDLIAATYKEAVLYATRIATRRGIRDEQEIKDSPKTKNKSLEPESPTERKNKRKTGLKVKFDDIESSRPITCRKELSEEEKSLCWLNRNDYLRMKVDAINEIKSFMNGQATESDGFTALGLEKYFPNLTMIRQRYRLYAVKAVFEEQELQELEGKSCPPRIAKTYQSNSIYCVLIARQAALDLANHSTPSPKMLDKSNLSRGGLDSNNHSNSYRKSQFDKSYLSKSQRANKPQFLSPCA